MKTLLPSSGSSIRLDSLAIHHFSHEIMQKSNSASFQGEVESSHQMSSTEPR